MKIKKILAAFSVCAFVLTVFSPLINAQSVTPFTIKGSTVVAQAGSQVELDIEIKDNTGFSALNIYYEFDKEKFTLTKVENKLPHFTMTNNKTTVWDGSENYLLDSTLATLTFNVAEEIKCGEYPVTINLISATNDSFERLTPKTENGVIVIEHSFDNLCDTDCNNTLCDFERSPSHEFEDDGDCSTQVKCTVCEEELVEAKEHIFADNHDTTCNNSGCNYVREAIHTAQNDDGDCTTAVLCTGCNKVMIEANQHIFADNHDTTCNNSGCNFAREAIHTAQNDDGDCTTAVLCTGCDKVMIEANQHIFADNHDTTCNNSGCNFAREAIHTAQNDDGDCTTAVLCTGCDKVMIEANQHIFADNHDTTCNNSGCNFAREAIHTAQNDDGDCTTAVLCTGCDKVMVRAKEHTFSNSCDTECDNIGCEKTRKHTHTVPKNLVAKLYKYNAVELTWNKIEEADGYYVYYKKESDVDFVLFKDTNKNSCKFENLSVATKYEFLIAPYYDDCVCEKVSTCSIYTIRDLSAPNNLKAELYGHDDIKVSWDKVKYATEYHIYYKKSTSSSYTYKGKTTSTSYKIPDLSDATKYNVKVVPCIKANDEVFEDSSNAVVSINTIRDLSAPDDLKAELYGHDDIKVSWDKVKYATEYRIYYKKSTSSSYTYKGKTTSTSYKIPDLSDATKYNVKVVPCIKANDEVYEDSSNSVVSINTIRDLSAPDDLKAELYGYDDIKVSWDKVKYANEYRIYYKKSTSSSYTYKGKTTSTSYKIPDLSDGVKYNVKVVPCIKANGKVYEDSSSATDSLYTLKKISTPTVKKYSKTKVKVSWSGISGESGYEISYSTSKSKTGTVTRTTSISKTITVKKGKTYYYKVRAYKTVNGKKIYASWSSVKSFKLK